MIQKDEEPHIITTITFGKWRQFMAAIVMNLSAISTGVIMGWQSPVIPQLMSDNPPIGTKPFTEDEISWFSVISLTPVIALPFCAWSSERFGRKVTGYCIGVPAIMVWVLKLVAQNFYYILIARLLGGITTGLVFGLVPVYVAEISSADIRGKLECYLVIAINIGIFLAFILGAILPYYPFAISGLIPPVIYIVAFYFMPETPTYLIRKGRIDEGTRSLMWLNNNDKHIVDHELHRLQQQLAGISEPSRSVNFKDLFRDRGTIKGFIISLCLLIGQQTSGYSIVINFAATIFQLANSSLSPNNSAILLGIIPIIGACFSTLIIERVGRRLLLLVSCGGMMICHLVFAVFLLLQYQTYDLSSVSWLPILASSCYALSYAIGLGPGAFVIAAEIFSPDIASLAISAAMIPVFLASFLTLKFFLFVNSELGNHVSFFILFSFCACTFSITYFLLPETKGRSMESIFEELNRKHNKTLDPVDKIRT